MQFGFGLLYNELAFIYDPVSWAVSLGRWRDWQRAAFPFLQGQQILELAHGPGHILLELEKAGFRVIGLDLSPHMGQIAHKRIKRSGSRVSVVRGKAQALPFAEASFSSVLATFPSEFILEPDSLEAVWRITIPFLKPALFASSILAFLLSFDNFNTTISIKCQTDLNFYFKISI